MLRFLKFLKDEKDRQLKYPPPPVFLEEIIDFTTHFFLKLNFKFNNQKILDVGCGFGSDAVFIAQSAKEVVAVDTKSMETWSELKTKYHNVKFKIGNICNLPFGEKVFEVIFIKDVLHHISSAERKRALSEIKRVVKPGGFIIIVEANKYNPLFFLHYTMFIHHSHFSGSYFESLISAKFPQVVFQYLDLHNYPTKNSTLLSVLYFCEFVWEKIPLVKKLSSYTVATIRA